MSTTPDPIKAIFTDYTGATTAEVQGGGTDRLWRRAKRRRIGRAAVGAAAALALLAPAGWLLVNASADEQGRQAAQEQTAEPVWTAPAVGNSANGRSDSLAPGFEDLVGAAVALPSFIPGDEEVDDVCKVDDAVVVPGWDGPPDDVGAVFLAQFSSLREEEGAEAIPVALFGCDYGDSTAFQVVALSHGDGEWSTVAQLAHTQTDGAIPMHIVGPGAGEESTRIGFAERYDPEANDLHYWFEDVALDAAGDPVSEPAGTLDVDGYSDLDVSMAATETGGAGVWDLTATIRNDGPRDAIDYEVAMCALSLGGVDMQIGLTDCINRDCVDNGTGCPEDWEPAAVIDELPPGESVTYEWTVTIDPGQWQAHIDAIDDAALAGPMFEIDVRKGGYPVDTVPRAFQRASLSAEFLP
jgi:hypothetical protein